MERRPVNHSAPYGHACMSCFKAKCRCIPRHDGHGCQRCHRLKKHCAPSNSVRRRAVDQKQDSDGRIARLEGLVSLLQSRNVNEGDPTVELEHGVSSGLEGLDGVEAFMAPFLTMPGADIPNAGTPETPESSAAACLDTFRSHMLPHFPFIHLPAQVTAQQLQLERPFLFRAIACVASPTSYEKRTRASEFKRALCGRAFLQQQDENDIQPDRMDQAIDFLLGLLTYVAWGWDHLLSSRLIMLAVSLVGEMRLDKPGPPDVHTLGLLPPDIIGYGHGPAIREHLLERQRAVLACFVLSSAISAYSGQVDALRWTPQMEQGLAAISANAELQTDAILALQVRLQLIAEQALHERDQSHETDHAAAEALLAQLEELRPAVQQHKGINYTLPAHFHATELTLHETLHSTTTPTNTIPQITVTACPPPGTHTTLPQNNNTNTNTTNNIPPNLAHLWHALLAIQSTSATLLALPPADFRGMAFPQWAQLTRCLAALHRFETLRVPDPRWTAAAVRGVVDLPVLLGGLVGRLEAAGREVGEGPGGGGGGAGSGGFMGLAGGVRRLRERVLRERVLRERVLREREGGEMGGAVGAGAGVGIPEGEGIVMGAQKGFFRNPRFWLNHFFTEID
ncbi:hypothetical protein C8A01DRAFT_16337 [Parachaetomium inaequale]|uniref:Zn(2)-C6 fungal-type domain-containing protein n=1 Tax=Parachaetomium inaequale TaxID=2588326 RepID=A0AAN6SRD0_9PEZI|nr:hypothetical protein C8A01DRAFT_16337 [Parachaetomium inaequale]